MSYSHQSTTNVKHTLRETETILRGIGNHGGYGASLGKENHHNHQHRGSGGGGAGAGEFPTTGAGNTGGLTGLSTQTTLIQQVKALSHEIDIERQGRKDDVKDIHRRFEVDTGRLDDAIHQLRKDQAGTKQELQDLRRVRGGAAATTTMAPSAESQPQTHQYRSGGSWGIGATTGPHHHHAAGAGGDHTLIERVVTLETLVNKQQLLLDERSLRINSAVSEAVDNKINLEIERIRSTARESARSATEDLLSLKMNGISSAFGRQVLEVEQTCAGVVSRSEEMHRRLLQCEDDVREYSAKTQIALSEAKAVSNSLDIKDDILREASARMELDHQKVDSALSTLKVDVSAQLRKASSESLQSQQTLQQYIAQRMDTLSAQGVLRDEVQRMISGATGMLEGEVSSVVRSQASMKQISDDARAEVLKRINTVEQRSHEQSEAYSTLQSKENFMSSRVSKAVADADDLKTKLHAAQLEIESLKTAQHDAKVEMESVKATQGTLHLKLETEVAATVGKASAAVRQAESTETKVTALSGRLDVEAGERSNQWAKHSESISTCTKENHKTASELKMLSERVEAGLQSDRDRGLSNEIETEYLAPLRKSVASVEARIKENQEAQAVKWESVHQDVTTLKTGLEASAKSNHVKESTQRTQDTLTQLEARLDEAVETTNNDRRRDFEQMHTKLLDVTKRTNDLRSSLEEVERKNQDGVTQALELHSVAQRTANEKATKAAVTELESRMVTVEATLPTISDLENQMGTMAQDIQRAHQAANTAATTRAISPTPTSSSGGGTAPTVGVSVKDAQRLITDYVSSHVLGNVQSLQEQVTENAVGLETAKNHTAALEDKVKRLEEHGKETSLAVQAQVATTKAELATMHTTMSDAIEDVQEAAAAAATTARLAEEKASESTTRSAPAPMVAAASPVKSTPPSVDKEDVKRIVEAYFQDHERLEAQRSKDSAQSQADAQRHELQDLAAHVDALVHRLDNTQSVIEAMNVTVTTNTATVGIHQSYFEEVKDKIEDTAVAVEQSIEVVSEFIAVGGGGGGDGGLGGEISHSLAPAPQSLADCFASLSTAVQEQDQKSQLQAAHVISILKPHAYLLPQIVEVCNTYSSFFQKFATQCGLDPEEFVMELIHNGEVPPLQQEEEGEGMLFGGRDTSEEEEEEEE